MARPRSGSLINVAALVVVVTVGCDNASSKQKPATGSHPGVRDIARAEYRINPLSAPRPLPPQSARPTPPPLLES